MTPEARKDPPTPLIGRLLLHALEPRRHSHLTLPILLPARQFLPVVIQQNERGDAAGTLLVLDAELTGL